jgi:hypothetical protein
MTAAAIATTAIVEAARTIRPIISPWFSRKTLRGESHGSRPSERLRQSRQHRQVGVECDPFQASNAERCEAVAVLQITGCSLHGCATAIEVFETLTVTGDAGKEPTAESKRQGWLIRLRSTERDDRRRRARRTIRAARLVARGFLRH